MRLIRTFVLATGAASIASFAAVSQVGAAPARHADISAAAATPTLDWQPCGTHFQCATAEVPMDYHHPDGTKVSIALTRLPATDQAHRIGTMFMNPGGPGGSGTASVQGRLGTLLSNETDGRFDIVGFDPRGLEQSTQATCFATNDEENALFDGVSQVPVTAADEKALDTAYAQLDAACAQRSPDFFAHLSTANLARDLDLLRRAVGDAQLTYTGYSYGSIIGANYAQLFPDKVRALVVDGVLDPQAWTTGRLGEQDVPFTERLHSAVGTSDTYGQFLRLCKAAGSGCAFSGGDPVAKSAALFAKVKQGPITSGGETVDYQTLVFDVLGAMVHPTTWPNLGVLLDQLYRDSGLDARGRAALASLNAVAASVRAPDTDYDSSEDVFVGVTCDDTVNPHGETAWARGAHREEGKAPNFGSYWVWSGEACAHWNIVDHDRYLGPWNARTAHPILVANTTFDPETAYQGAQAFAREFPGARLLTVNGYGHTTTQVPSTCAQQVLHDYLVLLQAPATSGATCGQDVGPFDPAAAHLSTPAVAPLTRR